MRVNSTTADSVRRHVKWVIRREVENGPFSSPKLHLHIPRRAQGMLAVPRSTLVIAQRSNDTSRSPRVGTFDSGLWTTRPRSTVHIIMGCRVFLILVMRRKKHWRGLELQWTRAIEGQMCVLLAIHGEGTTLSVEVLHGWL